MSSLFENEPQWHMEKKGEMVNYSCVTKPENIAIVWA